VPGSDSMSPSARFEDFYGSSRARVHRSVVALTGDQFDAEDCTAEAFSRAFRDWDAVRRHPAPDAWVVRTAVNIHTDRRRSGHRALRLAPRLAADDVARPPEAPIDPRLMDALRALPERQRQVLALRVLLELTGDETATELGISPSTVGVHLHRALATLRRIALPLDPKDTP